jgi:hypothetical protein
MKILPDESIKTSTLEDVGGNYWSNRERKKVSILEFFRKNHLLTYIFGTLLPMRFGNEYRVLTWLKAIRPFNLLDLGCGVGKIQIPTLCHNAVGIDIPGFPKDSILSKGYKKALVYEAPYYQFSIPEVLKPNAITIINLNAHICSDTFFSILEGALKNTASGNVHILMINEYKGHNFVYQLMQKLNMVKFNQMVAAQQHDYFSTRNEFITLFENRFPQLKPISNCAVATFPPSSIFGPFYSTTRKKITSKRESPR